MTNIIKDIEFYIDIKTENSNTIFSYYYLNNKIYYIFDKEKITFTPNITDNIIFELPIDFKHNNDPDKLYIYFSHEKIEEETDESELPHSDEPEKESDEPHSDEPHSDEPHSDKPHSDEPKEEESEIPHSDNPTEESEEDKINIKKIGFILAYICFGIPIAFVLIAMFCNCCCRGCNCFKVMSILVDGGKTYPGKKLKAIYLCKRD